MNQRGRPAGMMTPLRSLIAAEVNRRREIGAPVLISALARRASIDRRSARRILGDLKALGAI